MYLLASAMFLIMWIGIGAFVLVLAKAIRRLERREGSGTDDGSHYDLGL